MRSSKTPHLANPLWNPWANDANTLALYKRRCRGEAEEMTCAGQAAEILSERISTRESLLDAGCGGGYYFWSFLKRNVSVSYTGLDYTPEMIQLAHEEMCIRAGLSRSQFVLDSIENLDEKFDNVICFNVLTNTPHYALPLERLLACAVKRVILRESLGEQLLIRYTPDPYLDKGKPDIRVYHNVYPLQEVRDFMEARGFETTQLTDKRTNNGVEMVVDIPHYWRILLGERK